MKIDELLNRYFEGETSCREEKELRRFFTEEEVPEHLAIYRPLFVCLDEEAKAHRSPAKEAETAEQVKSCRLTPKRRLYTVLGGV